MQDLFKKLSSIDQESDKLDLLIEKLNRLEKTNSLNTTKIFDTYALNLLQPLLNGYPLLPFTSRSLRPSALITILNDIVANGRTRIMEFGSGISTIMMARLIKRNQLNANVITVENNESWSNLLTELLKKEDLDQFVKIICAPLSECDLALESSKWYDRTNMTIEISNKTFDLLLVDGPSAFESGQEKSRYPALPYLFDQLYANCSIYLNNASRKGEAFVLQCWEEKFSLKFQLKGGNLAYCSRGNAFLI